MIHEPTTLNSETAQETSWQQHGDVYLLVQPHDEPRLDGFSKRNDTVLGAVIVHDEYCLAVGMTLDCQEQSIRQRHRDQVEESKADVLRFLHLIGRL